MLRLLPFTMDGSSTLMSSGTKKITICFAKVRVGPRYNITRRMISEALNIRLPLVVIKLFWWFSDNCMVSPELDSRARQKYLYWPKKERMTKGRLEAFSDGVIAIIITIMVLELKVPHSEDISSLRPLLPVFISYVLSFIYVAIYWNNHHHMMQAAASVNGKILWANVHLLFWLSLIPFATAWMGENHFSQWPAILYGFVLFMNAVAYSILARCLAKQHGKDSIISRALGKDKKGNISLGLYAFAVLIAFFNAWISFGIYVLVAIIWLIPDRRFEDKLHSGEAG